MKRFSAGAASAVLIVLQVASAVAADAPTPGPARMQITPAERARAVGSTLSAQPLRTFRPALAVVPAAPVSQDVIVPTGRGKAVNPISCEELPLVVSRVTGNVTPGGVVTIHGRCFGARGGVQMLGERLNTYNPPYVPLVVQSWTDDTVTASIPAMTGVVDQPVSIRLSRVAGGFAKRQAGAPPALSEPVPMKFTARRETTFLLSTYLMVSNCAAGPGSIHDECTPCVGNDGNGAPIGLATHYAGHQRTAAGGGEDVWQVRLPEGWRFDHIDFQSFPPATIVMNPGDPDPAIVSWRVDWSTTHVPYFQRPDYRINAYPKLADDEEAHYSGTVYANGPIGTQHGHYTQSAQPMC